MHGRGVAFAAHGVGGEEHLHGRRLAFVLGVEHVHESDHALVGVAAAGHVFHAEGIGLAFIFTAVVGQHYTQAIKAAPRDYTAQLKMAELFLVQEDFPQAVRYAEQAQRIYPSQAQAYAVSGTARMMRKDFDTAYAEFDGYDKALPGNPNIAFFMGYCREGMGDQQGAANHYAAYLKRETSGDKAQYAYQRLVQWGYVRQ